MNNFLEKHFTKIVIVFFLLKILLLPWTAHPFDFWTFTNQLQRHFLYGWNIFEFWNKGNLLLIIWYPFYYLYEIIISLSHINGDNLYLLHFLLKLPFIFLDFVSGILIYKIILKLFNSFQYAKIGFLLWFINPIIYYIYGIHGHYELLTIYGIILMLYGLINYKYLTISLGFVISFTTKYFTIIFIPFIFLYLYKNKGFKSLLLMPTILVLMALSYLQLLFYPDLLKQIIDSIIFLSQPNSPVGINIIKLQPLNIFSFLNFISSNSYVPLNNIDNSFIFYLSSKGLIISAILMIILFFYRIYKIAKGYDIKTLINDLFLTMIFLLLFLGSFQPHYIGWLIPFLIIFSFKSKTYLYLLLSISLVGFNYCFRSEFGISTFFLDIYRNIKVIGLNSLDYKLFEGTIILSIILLSLILSVSKINDYKFHLDKLCLVLLISPWIFILIAFSGVINAIERSENNLLVFAKNGGYNRGIIYGEYEFKTIFKKSIYFKNNEKYGALTKEGILELGDKDSAKFKGYILYNGEITGNFNECQNIEQKESLQIFNGYSKTYYNAYEINMKCLRKNENFLLLKDNVPLNIKDIKLYLTNN